MLVHQNCLIGLEVVFYYVRTRLADTDAFLSAQGLVQSKHAVKRAGAGAVPGAVAMAGAVEGAEAGAIGVHSVFKDPICTGCNRI